MKRIVAFIAVLLMAQMAFAQHYIGVGASLSSPFQLDKSDATKPLFGWGEGVSLQYQFRRNHFLLSIGAAMSGEHPRVGVADENFSAHMIDTRGIEFNYLGHLISRRDLSSSLWFHTPVMVGFETYPFYMLVGAQYSLFIASWTHQKGLMASAADYYGRYYDDYIDDMFTHGYHDYEPVSTKGQMRYKNDIRLLVELGGTLPIGPSKNGLDQLLRIGAFAEVGLLDVLDQPATPNKTEWDVSQYMNVSMNHLYSAADANTGALRNIVVGVKVTCLFPVGGQPDRNKNKHKYYRTHFKRTKHKCHCLGLPVPYFLN
ncbi:MAG: hypothetical protein IJQ20_01290 [Paludibacteraceae bacterium]|nr:hypothetical protein [Paludibacteraceae bacterium]